MSVRGACGAAAVICVATFLSFLPCLRCGFTNWDDERLLVENAQVRSLAPANLRLIFSSFINSTYIPLTILSYAVEFRAAGLDPRVYHAVNLALHLANCLLVFALLRRVGGGAAAAFVSALLWGVHPLRAESVAWITARKDLLYTLFLLGGLVAYCDYLRLGGAGRYALTALLFILSLLAKGMAVVFPLLLVLTDYLVAPGEVRRRFPGKIPFFAVALIFSFIGFKAQENFAASPWAPPAYSPAEKIALASHILLFYLAKCIAPFGLCAFYPYPGVAGPALSTAHRLLDIVLAAAVVGALLVAAKRHRRIFWGGAFFLVSYLPVAKLVGVAGPAMAADRFVYLASVGPSYLAGLAVVRACERLGRARIAAALLAVAAGAACAALGALSFRQTMVWRDSITLWSSVIERHPALDLAYYNRGQARIRRGEYDAAAGDCDRAIELNSRNFWAFNNRAQIRLHRGDLEGALADLNIVIGGMPGFPPPYLNRAMIFARRGEGESARRDLEAYLAAGK